jgi:hypothetical protein
MEKRTQRDYFNALKNLVNGYGTEYNGVVYELDELNEFIDGRLAQLDKKSASKKPTKEQEANEVLKEVVLNVLTAEGATVTDIMGRDEALKGLSNQKVSALLRMLVADGKVAKDTNGKKSVFRLA